MTLAFRLAWSVLCCGHENRVRTRVMCGSGQPKKKISGRDFLVRAGPGISNFFWSRLMAIRVSFDAFAFATVSPECALHEKQYSKLQYR